MGSYARVLAQLRSLSLAATLPVPPEFLPQCGGFRRSTRPAIAAFSNSSCPANKHMNNTKQTHPIQNVLPFPLHPMPGKSSGQGYSASAQTESGICLLAARLKDEPSGNLKDESGEILKLLALAWDELENSGHTKMNRTKLCRIEKLHWASPEIYFEIERHGAVVLGSSRAEIQGWTVNLETRQTSCDSVGLRQIYPAERRLNTKPLAEEIATLILKHAKDDRLKWSSPTLVRVNIGLVIPETCAPTTLERRRRFRRDLENELQKAGWKQAKGRASNTYEKID